MQFGLYLLRAAVHGVAESQMRLGDGAAEQTLGHICESVSRSAVFNSVRPHDSPGSSVHEILQARILEWVAILFSRGSSQPRDQLTSPALSGGFFTSGLPEKSRVCSIEPKTLNWKP